MRRIEVHAATRSTLNFTWFPTENEEKNRYSLGSFFSPLHSQWFGSAFLETHTRGASAVSSSSLLRPSEVSPFLLHSFLDAGRWWPMPAGVVVLAPPLSSSENEGGRGSECCHW